MEDKTQASNAENSQKNTELKEWNAPMFFKENVEGTAGGPKGPFPLTENMLYKTAAS